MNIGRRSIRLNTECLEQLILETGRYGACFPDDGGQAVFFAKTDCGPETRVVKYRQEELQKGEEICLYWLRIWFRIRR